MRYSFEEFSEDNFEAFVVDLCQLLFGSGVHAFTKGKDAGRDCCFNGTADNFPSKQSPWEGKIIIQAKHTTNMNASCSDNDFFKNKNSILKYELAKIKERKKCEQIDGYLMVTNRKLTGGAYPDIIALMKKELNLEQVDIIGIENLARFADQNPQLVAKYKLLRYEMPQQFYEADIRNIIVLFSQQKTWPKLEQEKEDTRSLIYIDKIKKNQLNNVDDEYFSDIKSHSLKYFKDIEDFIKNPINLEYRKMYENTVDELRRYMRANRHTYSFVEILDKIIDSIIGTDCNSDIFKTKALVTVFVHFMYWNCDLGRTD